MSGTRCVQESTVRTSLATANRARFTRGIGFFGLGLVMVLLSSPAEAQSSASSVSLQCNQSVYFAPRGAGYQNVVSVPASSNPKIAQGSGSVGNPASKGRRRPGGTDGGITITAGAQEGNATITYSIEDFNGERATISVAVQVNCPPKQPKKDRTDPPDTPPDPPPPPNPPQPPKQKEPPVHLTMTHRTTSCEVCRQVAEDLNNWIDLYNRDPDFPGIMFIINSRAIELDDCEKKCVPPAAVLTRPNENVIIDVLRAPTLTPSAPPIIVMPHEPQRDVLGPTPISVTRTPSVVGPKPSVVAPAPTTKAVRQFVEPKTPARPQVKTTARPEPRISTAPKVSRVFTESKPIRLMRTSPTRPVFASPQPRRPGFAPVAVRQNGFSRPVPRAVGTFRPARDSSAM